MRNQYERADPQNPPLQKLVPQLIVILQCIILKKVTIKINLVLNLLHKKDLSLSMKEHRSTQDNWTIRMTDFHHK